MKKTRKLACFICGFGVLILSANAWASAFLATFQNTGSQPVYMTETNYSCMHSNDPAFLNDTLNPYTAKLSTLIKANSSTSTTMKENLVEDCSEAQPQFNFWYGPGPDGTTFCNITFSWNKDKIVYCAKGAATVQLVQSGGPSDDVVFTINTSKNSQ